MKQLFINRLHCFDNDAGNDIDLFVLVANRSKKNSFRKIGHIKITATVPKRSMINIRKRYSYGNNQYVKLILKANGILFDHIIDQHIIDTDRKIKKGIISFTHSGKIAGQKCYSDFLLKFELLNDLKTDSSSFIFRDFFSYSGKGVIENDHYESLKTNYTVYHSATEIISFRDLVSEHHKQKKFRTIDDKELSLREFQLEYCDFFKGRTLRSKKDIHQIQIDKNWKDVRDHRDFTLTGFQHHSYLTNTDNPVTHATLDWNFDIIPEAPYSYMLSAGYKRLSSGTNAIPYMHNEIESGSLPIQWRPFFGEKVTIKGRYVWDVGHVPRHTEIHPPHAIIRSYTTATNLGKKGAIVPTNRVIIGMGLSGGFPGNTKQRWVEEFGQIPSDISLKNERCYPTNVKKHVLKYRVYPPNDYDKGSGTPKLKIAIEKWESLKAKSTKELNKFLDLCREDDPFKGIGGLGFRDWEQLPSNFDNAKSTNKEEQPKIIKGFDLDGDEAYYDVIIDLSKVKETILGYYAVINCGWDVGSQNVYNYSVLFKEITYVKEHHSIGGDANDWCIFYGVNGQLKSWYTSNHVEEGKTYAINQTFDVWIVQGQSIVLTDNGIDYDGNLIFNTKLGKRVQAFNPFTGSDEQVQKRKDLLFDIKEGGNHRRWLIEIRLKS